MLACDAKITACFSRSSDAKCLRFGLWLQFGLRCGCLVAQCSATLLLHPPVARHLFRGSLTCDTPGSSRVTGATGPFRGGVGCSAILLLHLKTPQDSEEICCDTCSATGRPRTRVQLCAGAPDAKSLAMRVERCEPLRPESFYPPKLLLSFPEKSLPESILNIYRDLSRVIRANRKFK